MNQRIIVIGMLALGALLTLAACGGGAPVTSAPPTSASTQPTQASTQPTSGAATAAATQAGSTAAPTAAPEATQTTASNAQQPSGNPLDIILNAQTAQL